MAKAQRNKRQRDSYWKPSVYPYAVDYCDHFETPEIAYRDILPLLDYLKENRKTHVLYDPFYCNGRTAVLLNGLGFSNVIHECRDFYKDVDNKTVPVHDTFITNPPYSDDHKERCVSFALEQLRTKGRPFFILMPNYVAARDYYRRILLANPDAGVLYVIPSKSYEYDHPEGTGHTKSPFDSIWYCGIGSNRVESAKKHWNEAWNATGNTRERPRLVTSLAELERIKAVPTGKRPNPKQRRKRRKKLEAAAKAIVTLDNSDAATTNTPQRRDHQRKKSRYRNEEGKRNRRRF